MEPDDTGRAYYAGYELRPTGNGSEIVETRPTTCPNGHPLKRPNVQVMYGVAPDGVRRRGWRCWACKPDTVTWGIRKSAS